MKIGDRCFVRGYIDEIRKDTVIIRNTGGYFGTILSEVTGELSSAQPEPIKINIEDFNKEDWERLKKEWGNTPITVLPSVAPKQKRGKWIYGEDEYGIDGYHCDKCGFFVPWDYAHTFINYIDDYNFCPNCGARMTKEDV